MSACAGPQWIAARMMIGGSTVLVTGANRGLGRALVRALAEAGCAKVYAAARNVESIASDRAVQPVQLDITNTGQVAAAAARCHDVEILINNAGVAGFIQRPLRSRRIYACAELLPVCTTQERSDRVFVRREWLPERTVQPPCPRAGAAFPSLGSQETHSPSGSGIH
jgi:hypothetical protein